MLSAVKCYRKNSLTCARIAKFPQSRSFFGWNFTKQSSQRIILDITDPYKRLRVETARLNERSIYLIGEDHDDTEAVCASALLATEAANKLIAYFHEGVPAQNPYEEAFITGFFHRPLLNGALSLPCQGYNYGLEEISFFIPHYLTTYFRALNRREESFVDLVLSDFVCFKEMRIPMKQLAASVEKGRRNCFSSLNASQPFENGLNTRENFQICDLVQRVGSILEDIEHYDLGRVASKSELIRLKEYVAPNGIEAYHWALLIKGMLHYVLEDLERSNSLSPLVNSSFRQLMTSPFDKGVQDRWRQHTCEARNKIFVDRLRKIVPLLPKDCAVAVSIGMNHQKGVVELLNSKQTNQGVRAEKE